LSRLLRGKKWAYIAVMAVSSLLVMLYYFIPPDRIWLIFSLSVLISVVLGPQSPLLFAMYADTVDYSEWKTGRRSTGLIFAASTFALKVGSAFAGWITGLLLTKFGYAANQAQTADSLHGILLLSSFVPGVIGLIAAASVLFYKLDDRTMQQVGTDLAARRAAATT
jgi:GPH family glycoside/pentoside/hexuronide:cation symporter